MVGYQQNEQFYQRFHLIKIKVFEPIVESTGSMNRILIRWKHVGTKNVGSSLQLLTLNKVRAERNYNIHPTTTD